MTTLVAGGTGLIGSAIVRQLIQSQSCPIATFKSSNPEGNTRATYVNVDLLKYSDCVRVFDGIKTCYVCVGVTGGSNFGGRNKVAALDTLIMQCNILRAAVECGAKKITLISSSTVYGQSDTPMEEDYSEVSLPIPRYKTIGYANRAVEEFAKQVAQENQIQLNIVRPGSVFGMGDKLDQKRATVFAALLIKSLTDGKKLKVSGNTEAARDFVFVDDLARACVRLTDENQQGGTFNFATGNPLTIRQLANLICDGMRRREKAFSVDFEVQATDNQQDFRLLQASKYQTLFPDFISTPIEEALELTLQWYERSLSSGVEPPFVSQVINDT